MLIRWLVIRWIAKGGGESSRVMPSRMVMRWGRPVVAGYAVSGGDAAGVSVLASRVIPSRVVMRRA